MCSKYATTGGVGGLQSPSGRDEAAPPPVMGSPIFDFSPREVSSSGRNQDEVSSSGSHARGATAKFTINDEDENPNPNSNPPSVRVSHQVESPATNDHSAQARGQNPQNLREESNVDTPSTSSSGVEDAKTAFLSVSRRVSAFALEKSQLLRERARAATKDGSLP